MDYPSYIVTTLSVSLGKILPVLVTLGVGYLVFIKLPFFIFLRVLKSSREPITQFNATVTDIHEFKSRVEEKKKLEEEKIFREKEKIRLNNSYQFQYSERKKKEAPKKPEPIQKPKASPAEMLFDLEPGVQFSKNELKKKYHTLLKTSHPDKVSAPLKKEAEVRTKEINSAYQKLKARAA